MESETLDILKLHVVFEHILKFLSVEELKTIRFVSKLWSFEGRNQLLLRSFVRVPFEFHYLKSKERERQLKLLFKFFHPKETEVEGESGTIIKRSGRVSKVTIADMEDIEILQELKILGENVRILLFFWPETLAEKEERAELLLLLRNILPDLNSLEEFYFWSEDGAHEFCECSRPLSVLIENTHTHAIKAVHFAVQIFSEAELELELGWNPETEAEDEMLVEEQVEMFEGFSKKGPKLKSIFLGDSLKDLELMFPPLFHRFIAALNKTLKSSEDTLEEMGVVDSLSDIPGLEIPALGKLKRLKVVLPSDSRAVIPLLPDAAESSFKSLSQVAIAIRGRDWLDQNVYKTIAPSVAQVLLPHLNPTSAPQMAQMVLELELRFTVYEYKKKGRNNVLLCPPNSNLPADFDCLRNNGHLNFLQQFQRDVNEVWDRLLLVMCGLLLIGVLWKFGFWTLLTVAEYLVGDV